MKKRVFAAATAAIMTVSALGSVTAGAFEQKTYAEDVSVYVNNSKIDNGQYKPIIANDRTLVRLVPIFEALGYSNSYDSNTKTVTFSKGDTSVSYKFTAESDTAETISGNKTESTNLDVPATLQYDDVFYVPLRAFCDMVGLNITWDDATRSVYVTDNNKFQAEEQKISVDKALRLIKKAWNKDISQHYKVLNITDTAVEIADTTATNNDDSKCYKVSYDMNNNYEKPVYYVLATSAKAFAESDDTNTSCIILDMDENRIGEAN